MPEAKPTSPQTFPRVVPPPFLLYGLHSFYFYGCTTCTEIPCQDGNLEPLYTNYDQLNFETYDIV